MGLQTSNTSDSDYYQIAELMRSKSAPEMKKIYKQCKKRPIKKPSWWARIKSYFGKYFYRNWFRSL